MPKKINRQMTLWRAFWCVRSLLLSSLYLLPWSQFWCSFLVPWDKGVWICLSASTERTQELSAVVSSLAGFWLCEGCNRYLQSFSVKAPVRLKNRKPFSFCAASSSLPSDGTKALSVLCLDLEASVWNWTCFHFLLNWWAARNECGG